MFTLLFKNMLYILWALQRVNIKIIANNIFIDIYIYISLYKTSVKNQKLIWPRINQKLWLKIGKKRIYNLIKG